VRVAKTAKAAKKNRSNLRVTSDDTRRYRELCSQLQLFRNEYNPYAVGVEVYTLNSRQPGSAGAVKVLGAYTGVIFWAETLGLYVSTFLPNDLKKRFCGVVSASKTAVEKSLYKQVIGLEKLVQDQPKTLREHIADAAGHAVLVLEETDEMRKMLGLL
jgi:Holliday junction resolvasome RuvABC endonuclease subunit